MRPVASSEREPEREPEQQPESANGDSIHGKSSAGVGRIDLAHDNHEPTRPGHAREFLICCASPQSTFHPGRTMRNWWAPRLLCTGAPHVGYPDRADRRGLEHHAHVGAAGDFADDAAQEDRRLRLALTRLPRRDPPGSGGSCTATGAVRTTDEQPLLRTSAESGGSSGPPPSGIVAGAGHARQHATRAPPSKVSRSWVKAAELRNVCGARRKRVSRERSKRGTGRPMRNSAVRTAARCLASVRVESRRGDMAVVWRLLAAGS